MADELLTVSVRRSAGFGGIAPSDTTNVLVSEVLTLQEVIPAGTYLNIVCRIDPEYVRFIWMSSAPVSRTSDGDSLVTVDANHDNPTTGDPQLVIGPGRTLDWTVGDPLGDPYHNLVTQLRVTNHDPDNDVIFTLGIA